MRDFGVGAGEGGSGVFRCDCHARPHIEMGKARFCAERIVPEIMGMGRLRRFLWWKRRFFPARIPFKLADDPFPYSWVECGFFLAPETGLLDFSLVQVIGDARAAAGAAHGSFSSLYINIK